MKKNLLSTIFTTSLIIIIAHFFIITFSNSAKATEATDNFKNSSTAIGLKARAGGRYDNVRMCVASPPDIKGGMALDISFFAEFAITSNTGLAVNIPFFRPILFAASFSMLQFEPEITLRLKKQLNDKVNLIAGPSLGLSLHYGPDYKSELNSKARNPSFFALGPRIGFYGGFDFKRPDKIFNFELGIHPYITPLFSINVDKQYDGVVIGGMLDATFKFGSPSER